MDLNAGGSIVGGGSKDYGDGTLDSTAFRAGFVFKLGKINKPTLISMKEKKELQVKVSELSSSNKEVIAQNQEMKVLNTDLRNLVAMQNERLEKLERIALGASDKKKNYDSFFNLSTLFSGMKSFLISSK